VPVQLAKQAHQRANRRRSTLQACSLHYHDRQPAIFRLSAALHL